MNDLTVRPAALADIEQIARIYADAVINGTSSYELDPPTTAEMAARFETMAAKGYPYLVAESRGEVVGYAYAGPFRQRPAYRFAVENSVYVAPEAQGRGVGRELLESLIGACERLGFRQMIAVIGDGHALSPSVKLHERLGFRLSGRLEGSGYKHGRWLDTTFMQIEMNGGWSTAPDPEALPERMFRSGNG